MIPKRPAIEKEIISDRSRQWHNLILKNNEMKTKAQFKSLKKRITEETAVNVGYYVLRVYFSCGKTQNQVSDYN